MMSNPLWQTMRHHRGTMLLLLAEVACTVAVLSNSIAVVGSHVALARTPSGVDEATVLSLELTEDRGATDTRSRAREDAAIVRSVPGVTGMAFVDGLPFGGEWTTGVTTHPGVGHEQVPASIVQAGPGAMGVLGVHIINGRDFIDSDYVTAPEEAHAGLVTSDLEARLFAGKSAVGHFIHLQSGEPIKVVGVIDHLMRPTPSPSTPSENGLSLVLPVARSGTYMSLAVGTRPGATDLAAKAIETRLGHARHGHVVNSVESIARARQRYFGAALADARLMAAASASIIIVSFAGILGLMTFTVGRRRRTIGICRAIGASRARAVLSVAGQLMAPVVAGSLLGGLGALALSALMMRRFEVGSLPPIVPIGVAAFVLLVSMIAALATASNASRTNPVRAIRSN